MHLGGRDSRACWAQLLPSLLIKKWRSWVQILAKSTLSHKTVHSPAVGPSLPHTPPPGRNDASRVPSPQKGAMWGWCTQNAKHPG